MYGHRRLTSVLEWMGKHSLSIFVLVSSNLVVIAIQGFYWTKPENNIVRYCLLLCCCCCCCMLPVLPSKSNNWLRILFAGTLDCDTISAHITFYSTPPFSLYCIYFKQKREHCSRLLPKSTRKCLIALNCIGATCTISTIYFKINSCIISEPYLLAQHKGYQ